MQTSLKILLAAFLATALGCAEEQPEKAVAELWFYTSDDPHYEVTDSTQQLTRHSPLDSLIGEGSFLEGGLTHIVKAYTNDGICSPHSCAVFVELDAIGSFYRKSMDNGALDVWRSSSDSMNHLIKLAFEVAKTDSFLRKKNYARYLQTPEGYTDNIPGLANVDTIPSFPGGRDSLVEFLQRETTYPDSEWNAGIEGKQYLRFIVGMDGAVSNIEVIRPMSPGLDKEAVRAIGAMPRWKPAQIQGKPVPCRVVLPFEWMLAEKSRL